MPTQVLQRINSLANGGGRGLVNGLYPNEFEYYAVTLELVDSEDKTVDYLTFPVSPKSMTYNYTSIANIKKNMGGVTVIDTDKFIPSKYMMSGTFGRSLKILIGQDINHEDSTQAGAWTKQDSEFAIRSSVLNAKIKSGYGALKILEAIVDKSSGIDQYDRPFRLYLYNPAMGHSFLVKVNTFSTKQDYDSSNMVWQYEIAFTTIAPLDRIINRVDVKESLSQSTLLPSLQRSTNRLFNQVRGLI